MKTAVDEKNPFFSSILRKWLEIKEGIFILDENFHLRAAVLIYFFIYGWGVNVR